MFIQCHIWFLLQPLVVLLCPVDPLDLAVDPVLRLVVLPHWEVLEAAWETVEVEPVLATGATLTCEVVLG